MRWKPKKQPKAKKTVVILTPVLLSAKSWSLCTRLSVDSGKTPEEIVHLALVLFEAGARTLNIMSPTKPATPAPKVKLKEGQTWKRSLERILDTK